jgi:MFS family permease
MKVQGNTGRLAVLIVGSSLASAGYGAVLPYLYADIATTRGLGGVAAAVTFTAFALGSLVAVPFAGRLADGSSPVLAAALSRVGLAVAMLALGWASNAPMVWLASAGVGAAVAVSQPAVAVLLLAWTPEERTRDVFAWQFIGLNLALAAGGLVGGLTVNLATPSGTRPIYVFAAIAALASSVAVYASGRGRRTSALPAESSDTFGAFGYAALLKVKPVRWLLIITGLLTLACYAQYDSGLPAYAIDALHVKPSMLGVGVAANALIVAALTGPVVAMTRKHSPTTLLASCAALWVGCWLVFGAPLLISGIGSGAVVLGYAAISFGETVMAPVLNPFAATLAPDGAVGRTLGAVTGATTMATAVGPAISGVLLALGLPAGFIVLQLACCLGAAWFALRLGRLVHPRAVVWGLDVADDLIYQR